MRPRGVLERYCFDLGPKSNVAKILWPAIERGAARRRGGIRADAAKGCGE
jgi:hypothetical protein